MPKILYISLNGMTEALGESQVVQYLLSLSQANTIHLLSFEKEIEDSKIDQMKKRLQTANIRWKYFEYSNRLGIFSSFFQIGLAFLFLTRLIKKEKIQIIHARSLIPGLIGMVLKKIVNIKLLFDIRGFAIDEKIMEGRLREGALLTRLLKKIEARVYKNADHIVTLTHISKPIIETNYQIPPDSISVIPTCANTELFKIIDHREKNVLRNNLGFAQNDIIILRNGSLNGSYDLEAEFKLLAHLSQLNSNIKCLFLNKGQHALIETYLERYAIPKERCKIISAELNQVYHYINLADLCVFFIKPSFAKLASAPTKFAEIVACHLPAVTNKKYGDMEYYINQFNVGLLLDLEELHHSPEKSAQSVVTFFEAAKHGGKKADFDQLFANHFSKQIAVDRYQRIYESLI